MTEILDPADEQAPHNIFDLIFKRVMRLSKHAVIGFINSLFNANHPPDASITYLSTETVTNKLKHIISDIIIAINGIYSYLIEVQIKNDGEMALRVFEYAYFAAVKHKTVDDTGAITIRLPQAKVIYLEGNTSTPDKAVLRIQLNDDKSFDYEVESYNFLEHSLTELEQGNMVILLPFYLLKLRKKIEQSKTAEARAGLAEAMKGIVEDSGKIIDRAEKSGLLSSADISVLIDMFNRMYDRLYGDYDFLTEAKSMAEDIYWTRTDKLLAQIAERERQAQAAQAAAQAAAQKAQAATQAAERNHFFNMINNAGSLDDLKKMVASMPTAGTTTAQ
jgi:hypothetical protein